jgi:thioredoxin-related protein
LIPVSRLPAVVLLVLALSVGAQRAASEPATTEPGRFLGATETTYPSWFKDSFLELADDVEEATAEGRRLLILFHQDDCPYCNALIERNLAQKDIEEKLRANFDVVALNLRGDREIVRVGGETMTEKAFARALNVQFTPTLLFLDEAGGLVLRLNGYVPPREFGVALDYAAGQTGTGDYRDYLAKRLPVSGSGALDPADFFAPPPHDLAAVVGSGEPVAVFFEQTDCPNCASLHAGPLDDPETVALLARFHTIQLDMWSDEQLVIPAGSRSSARDWARSLEVNYAPTIVLFGEDGREIIRSEAYLKRFHIQSVLDYVASGAYRDEPDFQRYLTRRADAIRAEGRDVDIWDEASRGGANASD